MFLQMFFKDMNERVLPGQLGHMQLQKRSVKTRIFKTTWLNNNGHPIRKLLSIENDTLLSTLMF